MRDESSAAPDSRSSRSSEALGLRGDHRTVHHEQRLLRHHGAGPPIEGDARVGVVEGGEQLVHVVSDHRHVDRPRDAPYRSLLLDWSLVTYPKLPVRRRLPPTVRSSEPPTSRIASRTSSASRRRGVLLQRRSFPDRRRSRGDPAVRRVDTAEFINRR